MAVTWHGKEGAREKGIKRKLIGQKVVMKNITFYIGAGFYFYFTSPQVNDKTCSNLNIFNEFIQSWNPDDIIVPEIHTASVKNQDEYIYIEAFLHR